MIRSIGPSNCNRIGPSLLPHRPINGLFKLFPAQALIGPAKEFSWILWFPPIYQNVISFHVTFIRWTRNAFWYVKMKIFVLLLLFEKRGDFQWQPPLDRCPTWSYINTRIKWGQRVTCHVEILLTNENITCNEWKWVVFFISFFRPVAIWAHTFFNSHMPICSNHDELFDKNKSCS